MTRTSVDSGVPIALFWGGRAAAGRAPAVLEDPNRTFVSGVFVRLEVLPGAVYHRNRAGAAYYEAFFGRVATWATPFDRVIERAEWDAARYGLKAMDALHVAAATMLGVDVLGTTEGPRNPIHRLAGVRVVAV